jgi:hypothetical protein
MSLLNKLQQEESLPEIGYGIHNNCVITRVSNDLRKKKDESIVNKNCFIMIGKLGARGTVVAQKEISFFNLDHTTDWAYGNFFNQVDQMTGIVDSYITPSDEDDTWGNIFSAVLAKFEVSEDVDEIKAALTDEDTCQGIVKLLGDQFVKLLSDKIGVDGEKLRIKLSFDKNGNYVQQPKYDQFTENMSVAEADSTLKMTETEKSYEAKSREEAPTVSSALL